MQICGGGGNRTPVRNAFEILSCLRRLPSTRRRRCLLSSVRYHFHPHVKQRVVACHCRLCTSAVPTPCVVFSLQYRSYLRPIIQWHYGSIDYLDPLLYSCLRGYYLCRISPSQTQPYAVTLLRLVTPPGLVIVILQRCISPLQD